jgi:signal transduction histidine kinase
LLSAITLLKNNYRTLFAISALVLVFYLSKLQSYLLFHTLVELFSVVVAFAVFIVTWNSRQMQDNRYLHLVGISYIFIGALDLLHTLTYKGMNIVPMGGFPANQFWIATRFLEALTFLLGFMVIRRPKKLSSDLIFLYYFVISVLIVLSILVWKNFPVCFVEGQGQTYFKIYAEYLIIAILLLAGLLLRKNKLQFSYSVYRLLLWSLLFTILSEFCFTLYVSIFGTVNEVGHYAKLIAFFLIYKANVETGFISPTNSIFKNLKDSEEKYRTLAENLPGLILRFDQHLQCIYSNSQAKSKMAIGKHALVTQLKPIMELANKSSQIQSTTFELHSGTDVLFYGVQVIPERRADDDTSNFLVICQDVSELRSTERQLNALNGTKDKLFSIIAHDLKNPFSSLISFSELIRRSAHKLEREKIAAMADRMSSSARQAYALLENLLNWSRIQTGLLKPMPVLIQVNELFTEARELTAAAAQSKNITINFMTADDLLVFADHHMTATVIRNLISNALKFSYAGSEVTVCAKTNADMILFEIIDKGIGIAEEFQGQLLDLQNTFSASGTAAEKGTGLGLILCREFVEINGGTIWLESVLEKGTTFYFTLPQNQ